VKNWKAGSGAVTLEDSRGLRPHTACKSSTSQNKMSAPSPGACLPTGNAATVSGRHEAARVAKVLAKGEPHDFTDVASPSFDFIEALLVLRAFPRASRFSAV